MYYADGGWRRVSRVPGVVLAGFGALTLVAAGLPFSLCRPTRKLGRRERRRRLRVAVLAWMLVSMMLVGPENVHAAAIEAQIQRHDVLRDRQGEAS